MLFLKISGSILVAAAAALGGLYLLASHDARRLPPVQVTAAAAQVARQKLQDFEASRATAQATKAPVPVTETLTDDELSSLANQQLGQSGSGQLSGIVLHATSQGTIQGTATALIGGQKFPVYLEVGITAQGDQAVISVKQVSLGSLPVPGAVSDQIHRLLDSQSVGQRLNGYTHLAISITSGKVTISAIAQP